MMTETPKNPDSMLQEFLERAAQISNEMRVYGQIVRRWGVDSENARAFREERFENSTFQMAAAGKEWLDRERKGELDLLDPKVQEVLRVVKEYVDREKGKGRG